MTSARWVTAAAAASVVLWIVLKLGGNEPSAVGVTGLVVAVTCGIGLVVHLWPQTGPVRWPAPPPTSRGRVVAVDHRVRAFQLLVDRENQRTSNVLEREIDAVVAIAERLAPDGTPTKPSHAHVAPSATQAGERRGGVWNERRLRALLDRIEQAEHRS